MKKKKILWSPPTIWFLPLILLIFLTGCEKEAVSEIDGLTLDFEAKAKQKPVKINTFYGPAQPLGHGVTRAMVEMNHAGEPVSIGVKISGKVLEDLPGHHLITTLELPNKTAGLAFDHIDLDWNPAGHEPEGLYTVPHFDVHFYMVSQEYKMTITDPQKGVDYPDEIYQPANYAPPPEFVPAFAQLVPNMGVHWTRLDEPFPFTHTFIYGSYDDSFIFMEPMITVDYMVNHADGEHFPIAQPQAFERAGYYPTYYSISYDATKKEYSIVMSGMVWRS